MYQFAFFITHLPFLGRLHLINLYLDDRENKWFLDQDHSTQVHENIFLLAEESIFRLS